MTTNPIELLAMLDPAGVMLLDSQVGALRDALRALEARK